MLANKTAAKLKAARWLTVTRQTSSKLHRQPTLLRSALLLALGVFFCHRALRAPSLCRLDPSANSQSSQVALVAAVHRYVEPHDLFCQCHPGGKQTDTRRRVQLMPRFHIILCKMGSYFSVPNNQVAHF